jgi:hypothetical protein
MNTKNLIIPILAFALSAANASQNRLEVRLLKTSGAEPTEKTLRSIVEDPGAQSTPMVSVALKDAGNTDISQVTSYRFASEYTPDGEPDSFVDRVLGWTGRATITHEGEGQHNLKLDLTNVRIGTPQVYEVDGVQVTMPVFTSVKIPEQHIVITRGEWLFVKDSSGDETFFWAVRITNQKS